MSLHCEFQTSWTNISSSLLQAITPGWFPGEFWNSSPAQGEGEGKRGPSRDFSGQFIDRENLPSPPKMSASHSSAKRKAKLSRRKHGHCKCCIQTHSKQRESKRHSGDEDLVVIRGKTYPVTYDDFEMVPSNGENFSISPAKRVIHKDSGTPMLLAKIPYTKPVSAQVFDGKLRDYNETMTHSSFPLHVVGTARDSEEEVLVLMGDADISLQGFIAKAHRELGGVSENVGKKIIHSIILGLKELPGDTSLISTKRDFLNLTPANMYLSLVTGELRCDFGIYRLLRNEKTRAVYDIGEEYEYLYYMPERVNPSSAGKDMWTWKRLSWVLGLILIEIVTGKHPCSHYHSPFEKLKAIVMDDPENHIPKGVSPQMVHFLRLCLRKLPLERPTNAQLLRAPFFRGYDPKSVDLTAFLMGSPSSLMHNCRASIHRHLSSRRVQQEDCIDQLPLPPKIKDYLVAMV